MRKINVKVLEATDRIYPADRSGDSRATVDQREFARSNAPAAGPRMLRARWVLQGGKLRMVWTCEGESDAVPLTQGPMFNAPFIWVKAQYKARRRAKRAAITHNNRCQQRCAA